MLGGSVRRSAKRAQTARERDGQVGDRDVIERVRTVLFQERQGVEIAKERGVARKRQQRLLLEENSRATDRVPRSS
jgi:hypothetical protein